MSRRRSFDRDTALESALLEFWRYGYEATSIASLTAAMGIRPPSLYAAFGDKRRLFDAVIQRYQKTYGTFLARAMAEEPTGRRAIGRLLRDAAAEYTNPAHPPGCLIISSAVNCGPESTEVGEAMRELREAAKAGIGARIARDVTAGLLPEDTDIDALAAFYAGTLQGMSVQARDRAPREQLERIATLAMLVWPAPSDGCPPEGR